MIRVCTGVTMKNNNNDKEKKGKSPKKYPTTVTNATVSDCHFTDYFALRTNALFVPSARDVYVGS